MVSHCDKNKQEMIDDILIVLFRIIVDYLVSFFEADQKLSKLEIKHKSLILAQIERWRHALHMQVERQRRVLALCRRVANG